MITIVDTDAFIALAKPSDPLYQRALRMEKLLRESLGYFIVSPTTIAEFSLVALQRLGFHDMKKAASAILESDISVETISGTDTRAAFVLYHKQTTKDNSFCDCCVMALATRLHADCIFSFDRGYTKNGYMLAEDFFKKRSAA
ncbi:PIN domain-containing protein [Candidatus Gottesmanbacteria bacterium]|nr:PIN domain-containing protein [Candidatus Gottesmanbacteria bacterium]